MFGASLRPGKDICCSMTNTSEKYERTQQGNLLVMVEMMVMIVIMMMMIDMVEMVSIEETLLLPQ